MLVAARSDAAEPVSSAQERGAKVSAPRLTEAPELGSAPPSASELGLHRQDDGTFLYVDAGGRFSARIEVDGRVRFADRWKKPDAPTRRRARPESGRCCGSPPEGVLRAVDPFAGAGVPGPTEWAFAARGRDPVAAAKSQMLVRTEDFRARLAMAWHKGVVKSRLRALPQELRRLWDDEGLTVAERRAKIFL